MASNILSLIVTIIFTSHFIEARPPVQQGRGGVPLQPETKDPNDWNLGLEYNRYYRQLNFYFA